MMEFNQPKGIYQQIAEQVRERIAGGEWAGGDRIPSVREMAVTLGVNPNTVTRSYQSLLENAIIENRRGIGYFVAEEARDKIMEEMTSGDMDGAMDLALGMDGYETVSEFSADLSCSRSYAAVREYARTESLPTHGKGNLSGTDNITRSLFDKMEAAGKSAPRGDKTPVMKDRSGISTLLDRMTRVLEKEGKENQRRAARPVDQLFSHQLGSMAGQDRRGDTSLFKELEAARAEMQDRIHRMWSQSMEMLRS